jgi:hypothetical protein
MATSLTIIVEENLDPIQAKKVLSDIEELIARDYDLTLYDSYYMEEEL